MKNEADREEEKNPSASEDLVAPSLYRVIVHKDDFTPIEFFIGMMEKFFYMNRREAAEKTLEVHAIGKAVCGIFSRDFAESKVAQVMEYAGLHDHPLHCSMEGA